MSESQVFERFPVVVATVVAVVATLALTAIMLIDPRSWYLVSLTATIGWLAWALWVWPRVRLDDEGIVVRNTFSTTTVPFSDVESVRAGLTLQVRTKSGIRVSAFGVHGKTGMGREAIRTADAYTVGITPVRRVDDLRPSAARTQVSQVADIVTRRLETLEHAGSARTRRRPNLAIIVITLALLAADATAFTMTSL